MTVLVLTESPGEVLGHWLTHTVLLEIVGGAATLRWAERKETMERTSLLTISLALSLTVLGVTELLHFNGVLAAFVAGIVFNFAGSSDAKESQEEIQEAISRFFDLPSSCCWVWRCRGKGGWTWVGGDRFWSWRCSCSGDCLRCWP